MSILVSGGAGYIGSHTCVELLNAGYEIVVVDNLSNSCEESLRRVEQITGKHVPFIKADLCDPAATEAVFAQYPDISAVIHFAGLKAVGESVRKPLEYYTNNLVSTLVLLNAMRAHGVKNFVFSSSATVYGDPASVPIREDFPTGGTTNPYGTTKLFLERVLIDYCAAAPELNVASLRASLALIRLLKRQNTASTCRTKVPRPVFSSWALMALPTRLGLPRIS